MSEQIAPEKRRAAELAALLAKIAVIDAKVRELQDCRQSALDVFMADHYPIKAGDEIVMNGHHIAERGNRARVDEVRWPATYPANKRHEPEVELRVTLLTGKHKGKPHVVGWEGIGCVEKVAAS